MISKEIVINYKVVDLIKKGLGHLSIQIPSNNSKSFSF